MCAAPRARTRSSPPPPPLDADPPPAALRLPPRRRPDAAKPAIGRGSRREILLTEAIRLFHRQGYHAVA
ncbi:hypothetical protein [Dactylosporangium sp. CA-139066]|uniref:hypothetical protein n=1 Tax=Dactylosporangium sp. CA-139066 TaxID=3239930 RepID=UPI003D8B511E